MKVSHQSNPEKFMILLFPLITIGVFAGVLTLLWLITQVVFPMFRVVI